MINADQRCSNCKFWEHKNDDIGECHRHAPSALAYLFQRMADRIGAIAWALEEHANLEHDIQDKYIFDTAELYTIGNWPRVYGDWWCGEFERHKGSQ